MNRSSSEEEVAEIVRSITASIQSYMALTQALTNIQSEYVQYSQVLLELEEDHHRLSMDLDSDLPTVEEVAMSHLLANSLVTLDKELQKLKIRYADCEKSVVTIGSLLDEKSWKRGEKTAVDEKIFPLVDRHQSLIAEVQRIIEQAQSRSKSVAAQVEHLQLQESRHRDTQELHTRVQNIGNLLETVNDALNAVAEGLTNVKTYSERCDVGAATKAQEEVRAGMTELQRQIGSLQHELQSSRERLRQLKESEHQRGGQMSAEVNFSSVETAAQGLMDLCTEGMRKCAESVEVEQKVARTVAQVAIELANQARPLPMSPQQAGGPPVPARPAPAAPETKDRDSTSASSAGVNPALNTAGSRGSVTFTLKDLKALKEKKVTILPVANNVTSPHDIEQVEATKLLAERPVSARHSFGKLTLNEQGM